MGVFDGGVATVASSQLSAQTTRAMEQVGTGAMAMNGGGAGQGVHLLWEGVRGGGGVVF